MPQFQSATADSLIANLSDFAKGYIMAIYWTETGDNEQPDSEDTLSVADIEGAIFDCEAFQRDAASLLAEAYERDGYSEERAGHDFWLTRNGHGAGFWDRDELAEGDLGDRLTEVAKAAGVMDDLTFE